MPVPSLPPALLLPHLHTHGTRSSPMAPGCLSMLPAGEGLQQRAAATPPAPRAQPSRHQPGAAVRSTGGTGSPHTQKNLHFCFSAASFPWGLSQVGACAADQGCCCLQGLRSCCLGCGVPLPPTLPVPLCRQPQSRPRGTARAAGLPATGLGPSCLPASANAPRCAPATPASNCCLTLSI